LGHSCHELLFHRSTKKEKKKKKKTKKKKNKKKKKKKESESERAQAKDNTLGSMEIVGSTRTHVFVTRTVGTDPDKVSLSFSGFPTKLNHQFPQSKLWPRQLHECWRSLCKKRRRPSDLWR